LPWLQTFFSSPNVSSLEIISLTYQPWYNIFFSQQNNVSWFICPKNHRPNPIWKIPFVSIKGR
jgi:hypothetical protein